MIKNAWKYSKYGFESILKVFKQFKEITKMRFSEVVRSYLTHFSFLHMRSFDTSQDTSECPGGT